MAKTENYQRRNTLILRIYSLVRNGHTDHNSMDIKSDEPFKLCCLNYQCQKIWLKKPNATKISAGLATCHMAAKKIRQQRHMASRDVGTILRATLPSRLTLYTLKGKTL